MGRTPCCEKNGIKKGPWTTEEDEKLLHYIRNNNGYGKWRTLPNKAGLQRCGKSCRLRWINYLRPDIKRGKFTSHEEELIIQLHRFLGNKWSIIAARLPGRTDNEIKNYWNTHIRKRLIKMGIDPVTHNPRLDLLNLPRMDQLYCPSQQMYFQSSFINPEILRLATTLFPSKHSSSSSVPSKILGQDNNDPQHENRNQCQPVVYDNSTIAFFSPERCEESNGLGYDIDYGDHAYLRRLYDVDNGFESANEVPSLINNSIIQSKHVNDNFTNFVHPSCSKEMNLSYTYSSVEEELGSYCSNNYDMLMFEIPDIQI